MQYKKDEKHGRQKVLESGQSGEETFWRVLRKPIRNAPADIKAIKE